MSNDVKIDIEVVGGEVKGGFNPLEMIQTVIVEPEVTLVTVNVSGEAGIQVNGSIFNSDRTRSDLVNSFIYTIRFEKARTNEVTGFPEPQAMPTLVLTAMNLEALKSSIYQFKFVRA